MSFASPVWLWLLALAPLVVFLHMQRRAQRFVPAAWFWKQVVEAEDARPRPRRIPFSWPLALQLLALTAVSLGLAEPTLMRQTGDTATHVVVDTGVVMSVRDDGVGRTRLERAVAETMGAIDVALGPVTVWSAGPRVEPIALNIEREADLVQALHSLSTSDGVTDWGATADRVLSTADEVGRVVVIAADALAARTAFERRAGAAAIDLVVHEHAAAFANVAIERTVVTYDEDLGVWAIESTIRATGIEPSEVDGTEIVLSFMPLGTSEGLEFVRRELRFSIGGSATFATALELPGPGWIEVRLDRSDAFVQDNVYRAALDPRPRAPTVGILTDVQDGNPIARALAATGRDVDVVVTNTWPPPRSVDLLIVDGVPDIRDPLAPAEVAFPATVVWIGSAPGYRAIEPGARDPGVVRWSVDHPIVRGTDWGSLDPGRAVQLPRLDGGVVLVDGLAGPLVEARVAGDGRAVVVALESRNPAWAGSAAFVTLVADVVEWSLPVEGSVRACTATRACRVPYDVVAAGGSLVHEQGDVWTWPRDGVALPLGITDAWVPMQAGRWTTIGGASTFAVPVNLGSAAQAAVRSASLLDERPAASGEGERAARRWTGRSLVSSLIVLAVALIFVEGLIAGRMSEGFWRVSSWHGPGALPVRRRLAAFGHVVVLAILLASVLGAPWWRFQEERHLVVVRTAEVDAERLPAAVADWPARARSEVDVATVSGDAIDLEAALRTALAYVPFDRRAQVVLALDAGPTRGDHVAMLGALVAANVSIDLVRYAPGSAADVLVERVWVDPVPRAGDAGHVRASIRASSEANATLRLYVDASLAAEQVVRLPAGPSIVEIPTRFEEPDEVVYTVEIDSEGDATAANDRASVVVRIGAAPRVLVVGEGEASARFTDAMTLQGIDAVAATPRDVGLRAQDYFGIDGFVLLDMPTSAFTSFQLDALERYVREAGGGVVFTGGERAFGPGGYFQSPFDRMSPLSSQVPREAPEVAMLFVLDRSGSMQQSVGGTTRLELAKEATMSAIDLLGEGSQVAVVAFDELAHVVLPFTDSRATAEIRAALAPLTPGGGTSIYPGLTLGADLLADVASATKHVLVMTDGLSQPGDFDGVVRRLASEGATVSTVAIGAGADAQRIREIAAMGGGTSHVTTDFRSLPSILAQETLLVSGDPIVRERVVPQRAEDANQLLQDLPSAFPPLHAFVETSAKAAADVTLVDGDGRPLMAVWSYGAGRVMAFGSQAVGDWAVDWAASSTFPSWWSQWVRWTVQGGPQGGLDVRYDVVNDEVLLDIVALSPAGTPEPNLPIAVTVVAAARPEVVERLAREIAPGRYEARVPVGVGRSVINVRAGGGSDVAVAEHSVDVVVEYPAKLAGGGDMDDLVAFARATGGRVLKEASDELTSARRSSVIETRGDAWGIWAAVGAAAWFLWLTHRLAPGLLAWRRWRR